jgi:LEA14-like dessication related protein
MRKATWFAAAAALLIGAGCASLGRNAFKQPVVTVKNVVLNGVGLQGGSIDLVLNVYNPNGYRLDATRLTYKLLLDTVTFATGALDQRFTVQDKDSIPVRIPVTFTYGGIGEAGRQLLNTGSVNYRVTGDVTVGTPIGNFTIPYDRTGRFSALTGATR